MEKTSHHDNSSSTFELTQSIIGTIIYIAIMVLGIAFFVRLFSF